MKKLLAILLTLAMLLSMTVFFTACGEDEGYVYDDENDDEDKDDEDKDDEDKDDEDKDDEDKDDEDQDDEDEDDTDADADEGDSVKKDTIAVIAKGESHVFWQSVKAGAEAAGAEYGYTVTFQGPASESPSDVSSQIAMVQEALNNERVAGIALATIYTGFENELIDAYEKGIPVVELDSGLYRDGADITPGKDPTVSSVTTNNYLFGATAAENFYSYLKDNNLAVNGYKIGIIQYDSVSGADRTGGFWEKIDELAQADGITLDIKCEVKAGGAIEEYQTALRDLKDWGAQAIIMTNEGVAYAVYDCVFDDAEAYKDILFCGFDSGTRQYEWVKDNGENYALLVGSVAQDSYMLGYYAVVTAIQAAKGEAVTDVNLPGVWYNAENADELKDKNIIYMG